MPGIELTSVRTLSPGQANIGYTSLLAVSRVSRTNPRSASLRRNRRGRCTGNVMRASLLNAGADNTLQSNPPAPQQKTRLLRYPLALYPRAWRALSLGLWPRIAPDWRAQRAGPRQCTPINTETRRGWRRQLHPLPRLECFVEFSDRAYRV